MDKRKTNFDLLRIFAMFGIIVFHHFGNQMLNGLVELTEGFTADNYFYDFVNNANLPSGYVSKLSLVMDFCYGHFGNGGNMIFMLITGYFLFDREITFPKRVRTVARILYAILFHGAVITIFYFLLVFHLPGFQLIFTLPNWLSGDNLWYLQSYGCFILVVLPLLKLFEDRLTQKTHLCAALSLSALFFLAYYTYFPNLWIGRALLQFTTCYYIGGYVKKYGVRIKPKNMVIFSLSYLLLYFTYEYFWRLSCAALYAPSQYSYISVMQPFVCCLIYAMICFLAVNQMNVPEALSNIASSISSKTIGIYIFHYNVINASFFIANHFGWHNWSRRGYFLFVIVDSIVLFAAGYCIDVVRQWSYQRIEQKLLKDL